MTRWIFVAVVLALGSGPGCGKSEDPGPSCEKVTDHVFELMSKAFPAHGEGGLGSRKAYIEACEKGKMPAAERRCRLAAQDTLALSKCRKGAEGAKPTGKPPAPEPVKPPEATAPPATPPATPAAPATPAETKPAAP